MGISGVMLVEWLSAVTVAVVDGAVAFSVRRNGAVIAGIGGGECFAGGALRCFGVAELARAHASMMAQCAVPRLH